MSGCSCFTLTEAYFEFCDGCGSSFSTSVVDQHHNEVQDAVCNLATLVWSQVQKEQIVCEASHDDLSSSDNLVADLRVRGVWQPQLDALFDVRLLIKMHHLTRIGLLRLFCVATAETDKRQKYFAVCHDCWAGFTPLCFSADGMLGTEAGYFMHQLADVLCRKWEKPYGVLMSFVSSDLGPVFFCNFSIKCFCYL